MNFGELFDLPDFSFRIEEKTCIHLGLNGCVKTEGAIKLPEGRVYLETGEMRNLCVFRNCFHIFAYDISQTYLRILIKFYSPEPLLFYDLRKNKSEFIHSNLVNI